MVFSRVLACVKVFETKENSGFMNIRIIADVDTVQRISDALGVKSHPRRGSSDRAIYLNSVDLNIIRAIADIIEQESSV